MAKMLELVLWQVVLATGFLFWGTAIADDSLPSLLPLPGLTTSASQYGSKV